MPSQPKPWQLAVALALLTAVAVGVLVWRSVSGPYGASRMMQALPVKGAVKVYLDVEKMRVSGVLDELAGKKASEDPEYRAFAEEIGFDYRTDLDGIAAAFVNGDLYATVRGHFDWKRLSAYAVTQQGQCANGICSMLASQPHRTISFDLLNNRVLALAVTEKPLGVAEISPGKNAGSDGATVPPAVLWISAPGSAFKDPSSVPSGTRAFLAPLSSAQDASFSLQLASKSPGVPEKFEIRMDVSCASAETATKLAGVLTSTTDVLRTLIVQDKLSPDKTSLTGVLASGRFEAKAANVTGIWPMDRRVIEGLISGKD